jgi:hypothetical protein
MSFLIRLFIIVAILWSGWWWLATEGAKRGLARLAEEARAAGWRAELGEIAAAGYPLRLGTRIDGLRLADPATGLAVAAEDVALSAPAWWPGDLTLALPESPIRLAGPTGQATAQITGGEAVLRLHPGTALELESVGLTGGAWTLAAPDGEVLSAADLRLTAVQAEPGTPTYRVELGATDLAPGETWRRVLQLPPGWPRAFDRAEASGSVTFDRALDRTALEGARPLPRQIAIGTLDLVWEDLAVQGDGALSFDAQGVPEGALRLQVRNWERLVQMAEAAGALAPEMRPQAEIMLRALANRGTDPTALDLELTFADGQMALGSIPLGPAPRLLPQRQ